MKEHTTLLTLCAGSTREGVEAKERTMIKINKAHDEGYNYIG